MEAAISGHLVHQRKRLVERLAIGVLHDEGFGVLFDGPGRREAARGWHSLIRRRERKKLRPWSFIFALWAGDDGVVVIVHRHRYVRLPTLRTAASDGYDHIFGAVAELVGIEGGVVSGVINLEIIRR